MTRVTNAQVAARLKDQGLTTDDVSDWDIEEAYRELRSEGGNDVLDPRRVRTGNLHCALSSDRLGAIWDALDAL